MNFKKIERKYVIRITSVLLGIIIWLLIIYTENSNFETNLKGIDVQIAGENTLMNNNLVVVNKENIKDGSVVVRGKRGDIIEAMGSVTAVADVSNITSPGKYNIKVEYGLNSSAVYKTKSKTATVEVEVESTVLEEFDLEIIQKGNKDDNMIVKSESESAKVSVEGAAEDVEQIKHAVVFVDISEMKEENLSEYHISFTDEQFREISFKNRTYTQNEYIKIKNKLYNKAVLPIEVEFKDADKEKYVFETDWMSKKEVVVGLEDGVEADSLKVSVKADEYSTEAKEYTAEWQETQGIYIPDAENVRVKVRALPIVEKEITVPITVEANDGQKYTVNDEITLKTRGAEEYITKENIKAKINIKELNPGKHEVAVETEVPENSVWIKGKYSVTVEIQ